MLEMGLIGCPLGRGRGSCLGIVRTGWTRFGRLLIQKGERIVAFSGRRCMSSLGSSLNVTFGIRRASVRKRCRVLRASSNRLERRLRLLLDGLYHSVKDNKVGN